MMPRVVNEGVFMKPENFYMERRDTLTDAFSDEIGLAIPNINALDDICDAMEICDENNIPYDGLDDIEDFKDRIRLHFIKSKRVESRKTEVWFCFSFCNVYPPPPHPHLSRSENLVPVLTWNYDNR